QEGIYWVTLPNDANLFSESQTIQLDLDRDTTPNKQEIAGGSDVSQSAVFTIETPHFLATDAQQMQNDTPENDQASDNPNAKETTNQTPEK
ncbi:hypothetical protein M3M33_14240, partial [Loigolactobacillus coryniformis]|uniref:hypothetical protein n=1 Tax=Loigolactobacillus coryniformis TaxID=1610 RepID=UPI00201AD317